MGILYVEIDGVRDSKWNTKRVTVFQSIILQHTPGVDNFAQIRKHILFRLNVWTRGAFENLVKDTYSSAMVYLGKACGVQTTEELHRTFSNLVL